ncbi:MAG: hypothetical protein WBY53_10710 [Acidobacteriaceae bacterium]
MKRLLALSALATLFLAVPSIAQAPETGYWRAAGNTAKSITGDVALNSQKISINFHAYWIAQIRALTPAELSAAFSADPGVGSGNLYRLSVPGDQRMQHKNTLCGGEDVQWLATYTNGRSLQLAFFSTSHMPVLTPDALTNATNLCGVFEYER